MLFYISQETLCDNGFAKHNDTPFLLHHPFPPIQLTTLRSPCSKTTGNCKFNRSLVSILTLLYQKQINSKKTKAVQQVISGIRIKKIFRRYTMVLQTWNRTSSSTTTSNTLWNGRVRRKNDAERTQETF